MGNQASEHLRQFKNHNKEEYIVIYVTDKNGISVATSDTENRNKPIFQDGKPLITIVIPITEDGNTTGIIKAILKIDTLYKIISDVQIDETGHANLVEIGRA